VEQPVGVSVLLGQAFKLQVRTALGVALTFQWFKGTTAIAGAFLVAGTLAAQAQAEAGRLWVKTHRDYEVLARGVEARLRALVPLSVLSRQAGIGAPT
jgi:hypothetical protein